MLQTLPLFTTSTPSDPIFDKLMPELLHVRDFDYRHAKYCPGLHRNRDSLHDILVGGASPIDCSDGVLHIPAIHVLRHDYNRHAANSDAALALQPYSKGVNVTWTMPCSTSSLTAEPSCQHSRACFRGVHDGWIPPSDVEDAIRMGANLIYKGGDHFDIYDNVDILYERVPDLVHRVQTLMRDRYNLDQLKPIAFRVQVALPMDAADVVGEKSSKYLGQTINTTNYIEWLETTKRHNAEILYSVFSPRKPIRDTCNLLADQDANVSYAYHTSIFLSNGAGMDYKGGVALYVDADDTSRRRRIRRGVSIDGSRGRIIVSSGGRENRRCRLPTRAGIRCVLQIWWNDEPTCQTDQAPSTPIGRDHNEF